MQFEFQLEAEKLVRPAEESLLVGGRRVPLRVVRHRRARRYVLRLGSDGWARLTIPRGGSILEGKRFAQRQAAWVERQFLRQALQPVQPAGWFAGTEILFRGEPVRLEWAIEGGTGVVRFGSEV